MISSLCCRLPFDWKTPLGYHFAVFWFFSGTYFSMLANSPLISFMVGSCWLVITFINDLTNDLSELNANNARKINRQKIYKRFCNVIRQFCAIEQLSESDDGRTNCEFISVVFEHFPFLDSSTSSTSFMNSLYFATLRGACYPLAAFSMYFCPQ